MVGLLLADLLADPCHPGDELVVATLSGEMIVFNAVTMSEIWRTHLPGAIGLSNRTRGATDMRSSRYLGFLGFLGCLGFLGFRDGSEAMFGLYGLFGFFGFFGKSGKDDRP